jgi:CBS domain-containing protein
MTVAAVLRQKGDAVISVTPETTLSEAAILIASRRIGAVMVLDAAGDVVGILSERDIVRCVAERATGLAGLLVQDLMTRNVVMVGPETPVDAAMEIMDEGYFRHLPVCTPEGRLLGIVSIRDLVKHRIHQHQHDVETLKAYVTRSHMH